jgi:hypothetical protein
MPRAGAAMWMPTRQPTPGSDCSEKASSISVVVASSIEKRLDVGRRQVDRQQRRLDGREGCPARKLFEQEALQMIVVRRADGATAMQQVCHGEACLAARGLECLGLAAIAIRPVEQLPEQRRELGRQVERGQLGHHALDRQCLLTLLLETGKSGLENFRRRLAETPAALAVEIHRCCVQRQEQRRRFDRTGRVTEVLVSKIGEMEFAVSDALPQKVGFDAGQQQFRLLEQHSRRRLVVTQQDAGSLDLAALPGCCLDLQRAVVVGQDGGRTKSAVFFEQYMHRGHYNRQNSRICGSRRGKLRKLWSPPSMTICRLPA